MFSLPLVLWANSCCAHLQSGGRKNNPRLWCDDLRMKPHLPHLLLRDVSFKLWPNRWVFCTFSPSSSKVVSREVETRGVVPETRGIIFHNRGRYLFLFRFCLLGWDVAIYINSTSSKICDYCLRCVVLVRSYLLEFLLFPVLITRVLPEAARLSHDNLTLVPSSWCQEQPPWVQFAPCAPRTQRGQLPSCGHLTGKGGRNWAPALGSHCVLCLLQGRKEPWMGKGGQLAPLSGL